jgi:hypothetical protein
VFFFLNFFFKKKVGGGSISPPFFLNHHSVANYNIGLPMSQYFKIYFILFLGNALKLCCNLSYIFFSLSRFFIASSNKSSFASISCIKLRILYIVIFCVSLIVSSFKIAEYKPNEYHSNFDLNFPYNLFDLKYCQFSSVLISNSFKFKCQLFPIINLLNSIVNNISIFDRKPLHRYINDSL